MKRLLLVAGLLLGVTPTLAADGAWSVGIMVDGSTNYAEYSIGKRSITLYCRNGLHEFIYSFPVKDVPPEMVKWDAFDLVMLVDGDTMDYTQVAVAWAGVNGTSMALHLGRMPAWEFQSSVSGPNTITMGFSDIYLPGRDHLYAEQAFVFGDGASERAAMSVLMPCKPNDPEPDQPVEPPSIRPN